MQTNTQIVINLLLFIVILFATGYIYKRFVVSGRSIVRKTRFIESLDKCYLSNDKWLEIIKIGDRIIVIGVTPTSIREIKEIAQEDLHEIQVNNEANFFAKELKKHLGKKA